MLTFYLFNIYLLYLLFRNICISILNVLIPWRRKWQPIPYSCLEKPMDREAHGLQSMGSKRVGHDWVRKHTHLKIRTYIYTLVQLSENQQRRKKKVLGRGNKYLYKSWKARKKRPTGEKFDVLPGSSPGGSRQFETGTASARIRKQLLN